MSTENKLMSLSAINFGKLGIEIPKGAKAAESARASLIKAHAQYVPMGTDCDNLMIIANAVRESLDASDTSRRNAAVMFAAIDETHEYTRALNANGKPYSSTLALARDLFPTLEKSTLANLIGAGRTIYLPALNGAYGKAASQLLLEQSPTNAGVLKSVIADDSKRDAAIKAVSAAVKKQGKLTKKAAQEIVKSLKDGADVEKSNGNPDNSAAQDANAQAQVTEMSEQDKYNHVLAKMMEYVPQSVRDVTDGDITVMVLSNKVAPFKRTVQEALVSSDPGDAKRVLKALLKVIVG